MNLRMTSTDTTLLRKNENHLDYHQQQQQEFEAYFPFSKSNLCETPKIT